MQAITIRLAQVVLIGLVFSIPVLSQEQSLAPAGYEWLEVADLRARFLKPVAWEKEISQGKLMSSLTMHSGKNPDQTDVEAKLSVNVISNLSKINFRLLSGEIDNYIENLSSFDAYVINSRKPVQRGQFMGESVTLSVFDGSNNVSKEERLYLAHNQRDWLMVVTFQSAEAVWEEYTAIRDQLMQGFVLH